MGLTRAATLPRTVKSTVSVLDYKQCMGVGNRNTEKMPTGDVRTNDAKSVPRDKCHTLLTGPRSGASWQETRASKQNWSMVTCVLLVMVTVEYECR